MHDVILSQASATKFLACYKTVNGKGSCTTIVTFSAKCETIGLLQNRKRQEVMHDETYKFSLDGTVGRYKTVNGKRSCTTTFIPNAVC